MVLQRYFLSFVLNSCFDFHFIGIKHGLTLTNQYLLHTPGTTEALTRSNVGLIPLHASSLYGQPVHKATSK